MSRTIRKRGVVSPRQSPRGPTPSDAKSLLLSVSSLIVFLWIAWLLVPTSSRRPWDFETYYHASAAVQQGLDPYNASDLASLAGRPVGMPFIYPPVVLPLLLPLTNLPLDAAIVLWLGAKVLLLMILAQIWRVYFLPGINPILLSAIAAFGFNAAVIWDLKTGNVAILEQLLLWSAFAFYKRDRRVPFACLVAAASLFKIMPIVFLGLLLVPSQKRAASWRLGVGVALAYAVVVVLPSLLGPAWARGFLPSLAQDERPWGLVNPASLGIIDSLLGDHRSPLLAPPFRALGLWAALCGVIVALSWRSFRQCASRRDPAQWIHVSVVLFALLTPRLMVYSYLMLIPPVLALMEPVVRRLGGYVLVGVLVVAQPFFPFVLGSAARSLAVVNYSYLLILTLWLLYLWPWWGRAAAKAGTGSLR